jgi:3-hydroxyacyl-[acyl-carrier-protein] dehydratase
MNIQEIMRILPHRYPFLLLDRIVELRPGKMAVGIKNISINEPYFAGHFPGQPIMPGVMMIEAMAQVGACALLADELFQGQLAYLAGVDRICFKRLVIPGDTLTIRTELNNIKGKIGKGKGEVKVDQQVVCAGEFIFALTPREVGQI